MIERMNIHTKYDPCTHLSEVLMHADPNGRAHPIHSQIQSVADICCGGKMVSVLEGGYGQSHDSCESGHGGAGGAAGLLSSMTRWAPRRQ